jgi:Fur family ferric uptake transcriptional regulator
MSTFVEEAGTIRDEIRAEGLRATLGRVATLQLLREASSPITHADVAERLDDVGVDKATAFWNLNDMTEAGLLRRTELGEHVFRFEEIRPDENGIESHPHFLCSVCGSVSCLDNVKLTAGSVRESSKVGEVVEILLRGRCNDCR